MRLSAHYALVVEERKVRDYLLNPSHPDGAPKARVFHVLGYDARRWRTLAESLKQHARDNDVAAAIETSFGKKYTVRGPIQTIAEEAPISEIVSVWIAERGSSEARLVTAYPVR